MTAGRTLREITPWLIERYKQERSKALVRRRPIRPTTINRELACLKRMFNLGMQWGKAESNPVRAVTFFREEGGANGFCVRITRARSWCSRSTPACGGVRFSG